MKNKKISMRTGIIMCVLCVILTCVVMGNPSVQEIVAYLNYSVNVEVDGEIRELHDVEGNRVYPITYNGTTYVPVRGVSELLGASVDWNGETNTVIIKKSLAGKSLILGSEMATNNSYILDKSQCALQLPNGEFYSFENGLYCKSLFNEDIKYTEYIGLAVPSDIRSISFNGYSDVSSTINVFNQQGKLLKSFYVNPNTVIDCKFDIDASKNTKIHIVGLCQDESATNRFVKVFNIIGK